MIFACICGPEYVVLKDDENYVVAKVWNWSVKQKLRELGDMQKL